MQFSASKVVPGPLSTRRAFTLTELLVVIAIIGLLASIGLPAIKGMNKSNAMIASNRQFEDDLAYARQRAVADHTSVYVVFVPPTVIGFPQPPDAAGQTQLNNLIGGQYTTYALISMRLIGEQPGRATPHYLTPWRNLPNGVFIAPAKFGTVTPQFPPLAVLPPASKVQLFLTSTVFPFPNATNFPGVSLPYVGFDYEGRLTYAPGISGLPPDEYIPLARGSILYGHNPDGSFASQSADIQESPSSNSVSTYNVLHINALTGRVKLETPQIQ